MADPLRSHFDWMRAHPRLTLLAALLVFALVEPRAALGLLEIVGMFIGAVLVLVIAFAILFHRPGLTWTKIAALVFGMRWANRHTKPAQK